MPLEGIYDIFIGTKDDARTLLMIGVGILLIAAINFMNLSTAQAAQRIREVGVRKVLGAISGQLQWQFVVEAMLVTSVATVIGVALAIGMIPYFNDFFDISISLAYFSWAEVLVATILVALLLGVFNGAYPAIYLSSIKGLEALRRRSSFGGSTRFRNVMVVLQFSIALFLIACTLYIQEQITYMSSKNMGFRGENVMIINASRNDFEDQDQGLERLNTLKTSLKQRAFISDITLSRSVPTQWTQSFVFVRPSGWNGDPLRMRYTFVNANFFDFYDIPLLSGPGFLADDVGGDQRTSVVLNEAAMRAFDFNMEDQNQIQIGDFQLNVVGTVQDFNFETLQNDVAPTLIFHRTAANAAHRFISCKVNMENINDELETLGSLWETLGATTDFSYSFMDDNVQRMYESERRYLGLVTFFSGLSILVACLGLYGLTLFVIEKRRKEISIRKVLGARMAKVLTMIFSDFAKSVILAFVLSAPLVVYFVTGWLESYHYRIAISWITLVGSLLIVMLLVILTVLYQSLKAAKANPVRYLKEE